MMMLQRWASVDVTMREDEEVAGTWTDPVSTLWKYLTEHWDTSDPEVTGEMSLFQRIVANDWLVLTYLMPGRMDQSKLTISTAKTLLSRQTEEAMVRGREVGKDGPTLLC